MDLLSTANVQRKFRNVFGSIADALDRPSAVAGVDGVKMARMGAGMDFSRTKFAFSRHPLSYSKVRALAGPAMRVFPIRKRPQLAQYLNVGAGPHAKPDFFNIDYDYHPGIDLFWDLKNPLPIAANSIGGIFSEHCLEHLAFETTQSVLQDFYRVLQPGRSVRISVPDGEIYARAYVEGHAMPFAPDESAADPSWTPMQSINQAFYGHGHRFIYDFRTMQNCLHCAGFVRIEKCSFGAGRDTRLLIDQPSRRLESLYVEATKLL